jgi:hydroxymethylglutaryl-CoA lyase
MGERVRIYEVGPRDGLQNEAKPIPTEVKAGFIGLLADAGLQEIEATSFVAPSAIPQLGDAEALFRSLERRPGVRYPVLVPNVRGLARAEAAGADAIAVFTAASNAFTMANIGMSVDESLQAFAPVLERARRLGWWRRGYVSTAFGCPYTGRVEPARAVEVARRLLELGVDEVCFGDTIGVGVPGQVAALTGLAVEAGIDLDRIAYHFHDTRGTALANVAAGLDAGVRCFDSAAGGTGGCPYAPGAAGNLATEDLVYFLDASGWDHGVLLDGVLVAARFIADALGRPLATKVGQAGGWDDSTGAATGRA